MDAMTYDPHDTLARAAAALYQALVDGGTDPTVARLATYEQANLTPRERREFDAWCAGRLPAHDTGRTVLPDRSAPSATRAGTLTRGQWRGVPVMPRGAPRVSGPTWVSQAALAAGDPARARADLRAAKQGARRDAHKRRK